MEDEKLVIYYSVSNCGDGSAFPWFFDTKELADWHQEHDEKESWGESCVGQLEVFGNNLSCPEAETAIHFLLEHYICDDYMVETKEDEIRDFMSHFFQKGLPTYEVKILDEKYYGIYADGELIYKQFSFPGNTSEEGKERVIQSIEYFAQKK